MQTGLFDPDLNTKINRTMAQIQKRGFELKECYKDLAGLGSYFSDNKALARYKDKLYRLLGEGRHYEQIGEAACDNLYDLEALAVAAYGPRFTRNLALIADFSDCLDLVMHRTHRDCGVDTKERYLEILEFTHFVQFFSFNSVDKNHKEKEFVMKITVVVALDLGCGNTKSFENESE